MKAGILFTVLFSLGLAFGPSCNRKAAGDGDHARKEEPAVIRWMSFAELEKAQKKEKRKVLVDLYTDWCGWCKKMDASTFSHPVIAAYVSKHFYAVKFNAEVKDTIVFNGHTYMNGPQLRATHQLAMYFTANKPSYPTSVYLDEKHNILGPVPGYMDARTFEAVLHYYAEEAYKTIPWNSYYENFQGEIQ